jgi:hypothetical protein
VKYGRSKGLKAGGRSGWNSNIQTVRVTRHGAGINSWQKAQTPSGYGIRAPTIWTWALKSIYSEFGCHGTCPFK